MSRPERTEIDWRQVHERLEQAGRVLGETNRSEADERLVLERRAASLAEPPPEAGARAETIDLLVFSRGGEAYAVDAGNVAAVLPLVDATPVPFAPPAVLGVVNHRGRILPVIDVARLLRTADEGSEPALLIAVEVGEAAFGVTAELMPELVSVGATELLPATELAEQPDSTVRGVTGDMAMVLDVEALARDPRVQVDDEVG